MSKIIRSTAFSGGVASYQPLDADEAWVSDHPNLHSWVSGSGLAMREVDNVWDDLVKPAQTYTPIGTGVQRAMPSAAVGSRPSIRCPAKGVRGTVALPVTYTIISTARFDALTGSSQVVVGDGANTFPRLSLGISGTGNISLTHNVGSSLNWAIIAPVNTDMMICADFNDSTKAARLFHNNTNAVVSGTFVDGHGVHNGYGIGGMGDGNISMTGDIGDVLIFNSVLSDADRQRAMRYLARRIGLTLAG